MDQLRTHQKTKQKINAISALSDIQQYSSSSTPNNQRHVPLEGEEHEEEEEDTVLLVLDTATINKYENDSFMDSNSVGGGLNYLMNRDTLGYYTDNDNEDEEEEKDVTRSPSTPRTIHGYDDNDDDDDGGYHDEYYERGSPKEVRSRSSRDRDSRDYYYDDFNIEQYKSRNFIDGGGRRRSSPRQERPPPPPPPTPRDPSVSGDSISVVSSNNIHHNPENTHPPANNELSSSSIASAAIISTMSASQITFDTHTTIGSSSNTTNDDHDEFSGYSGNNNNRKKKKKGLYSVKTSSIIPHQVTFPVKKDDIDDNNYNSKKKKKKNGLSAISEEGRSNHHHIRSSPRDSPRSASASGRGNSSKRRGIDASPVKLLHTKGIDASPGIQNMSTELIEYKKSKALRSSSKKSDDMIVRSTTKTGDNKKEDGSRRRRRRSKSHEDYSKRDRRSRRNNNACPQDQYTGRESRRYNKSSSREYNRREGRGNDDRNGGLVRSEHPSRQLTTYNWGDVSVQSSSSSSWRSIRHDIDNDGYCMHHPNVQLMKRRSKDGSWKTVRKKCPECIIEDCPSMMGYDNSIIGDDNYGSNKSINRMDESSVISHRQQALMLYSSSGQYHMSANNSLTNSDSSSFNSSSSSSSYMNNDELMLNMGLSLTTPEEMEEEEATLRLKRRLAARAYHFSGNTWLEDWMQYLSNTHTVLGLFFHHPLHPMGFQERLVILFGSIAIGLTISNFTYLYFIRNELGHDEEVLNIPIIGYSVSVTKLMITLWTLGSFIHTVFDLGLWHMKACTICRYQGNSYIDERLIRWGRVVGLFIVMIAMGAGGYAVLLRASIEYKGEGSVADEVEESIMSNELYHIEFEDKRSFRFLLGYLVEFVLALFVYYPIAVTILFSGVLGCGGRIPVLGGRPREMKKERRYEMRKARPKILKANIDDEEEEEMDDCDPTSDVYATSYRDDESRDRFNEDQII